MSNFNRNKEYQVINDLVNKLHSANSIDLIFQTILDEINNIIDCDLAFIFQRVNESLVLRGIRNNLKDNRFVELPEHKVGECMCGLAVKEAKALYSKNIYEDLRCTWEECKKTGLRSFAALPLITKFGVLGVIGISSIKERNFEVHSTFLETIANLSSLFLYNAFIFEELEKEHKSLLLSEDKYRKLFENSIEGVYQTTFDGKYITVNPAFAKMFGFSSPEEMITTVTNIPKQLYVNPHDREIIKNTLLEKGKIENFETELYKKNGERFWVSINARLAKNEIDQSYYIEGTNIDITERKIAELKLKESEERYRQLAEESPFCFSVFTPEGEILFANRQSCSLIHSTPAEIIGKNLFDFLDIKNASILKQRLSKLTTENPSSTHIEEYDLPDGQKLFYEWTNKAIFDDKGNIIKIQSIGMDISDKMKTQEELFETEEMLRLALDATNDGIWDWNMVTNEVYWSGRTFTMLGYEPYEFPVSLDKWKELLHPDDVDSSWNSVVQQLSRPDKSFSIDFRIRCKDNKYLWVNGRGKIVDYDKLGNPIRAVGTHTNINEKKYSEEIQKIQYIIADALITTKDLNSLSKIVFQSLTKILGTKNFFIAHYLENDNQFKIIYKAGEKEIKTEWRADKSLSGIIVKTGLPLLITKSEIENLLELNEINLIIEMPACWLGVPLRTRDKIFGVMVVFDFENVEAFDKKDIEILETIANQISSYIEWKKAEEFTLKLSKSLIQSPVSILITDYNGNIEYVNPKFEETSGYSLDEVVGKNPRILNSGFHTKEFYSILWHTILSGKDWQGEIRNKKKNGELYWENVIISPIKNDNGDITHFIGIKEDITEKKQMVQELIVAKEKAEEMNRLKTHFFASMSHELRTPMTGVLGYTDILLKDLKDPKFNKILSAIKFSGQRLLNTLNTILEITKLESEKYLPNIQQIDLISVIKNCCNQFVPLAEKKNLSFNFLTEYNSYSIHYDPHIIDMIVSNLVDNAIKFTEKGYVEIKCEIDKNNECFYITVTDTGIGIPKEKQVVIWQEFRQVSEGMNRSFEGTGLGLSIVLKYVKIVEGKIFLNSEVDKGSVFSIKLPLNLTINYSQKIIEKKKHILLIEDDDVARDFIIIALKDQYIIDYASNAEAAIEKLNSKFYDAILMDINLGAGLNGLELTKIIRQNPLYKDVNIIAVTAYAMEKDKQEFLSKGLSSYLAKPFTKRDLLNILDKSFGN